MLKGKSGNFYNKIIFYGINNIFNEPKCLHIYLTYILYTYINSYT